jgi:hypothetical protein
MDNYLSTEYTASIFRVKLDMKAIIIGISLRKAHIYHRESRGSKLNEYNVNTDQTKSLKF